MKRHQQGFSLLELLLACGLSVFLLTNVLFCYTSSKKMYHLTMALMHMQENAHLAAQILLYNVRMAGYIGCPRLMDIPLHQTAESKFLPETRLLGWHHGRSTTDYPLPLSHIVPRPDSDILLLQKMSSDAQTIPAAKGNQVQLSEDAQFSSGDWLIISDCLQAETAQVQSQYANHLLLKAPLINHYTSTALMGHWQKILYYVAKTDRKDKRGHAIYALYSRDLNLSSHIPSEIVEGIDKLQIEFGIKNTLSGEITYFTADQVPDWRAVCTVKLRLLVDSMESVADYVTDYQFAGRTYTSNDQHLRREWDVIAAVREPII